MRKVFHLDQSDDLTVACNDGEYKPSAKLNMFMQLNILCISTSLLFRLVDCTCDSNYDPIKHATWIVYDTVNDITHYPSRPFNDEDKMKLLKVTEWKPNDPLGGFVPSTGKIICELHPLHDVEENTHFLELCQDAGRRIAEVVSIHENIKLLFIFDELLRKTKHFGYSKPTTFIPVLDIGNEIRYYPQPLVKNMFFEWEYESLQAPFIEYDSTITLNPGLKWNDPCLYNIHIEILMHEMVHTLGFHISWRPNSTNMLLPPISHYKKNVKNGKAIPSQHYDTAYCKFIKFKFEDNWITTTEVRRILSNRCRTSTKKIATAFNFATTTNGHVVFASNLYHDIIMSSPDSSHVDDNNADYLMNPYLSPNDSLKRSVVGSIGPKTRAILGAMGYGIKGLKGVGTIAVDDAMKIIPFGPITTTKESRDDDDKDRYEEGLSLLNTIKEGIHDLVQPGLSVALPTPSQKFDSIDFSHNMRIKSGEEWSRDILEKYGGSPVFDPPDSNLLNKLYLPLLLKCKNIVMHAGPPNSLPFENWRAERLITGESKPKHRRIPPEARETPLDQMISTGRETPLTPMIRTSPDSWIVPSKKYPSPKFFETQALTFLQILGGNIREDVSTHFNAEDQYLYFEGKDLHLLIGFPLTGAYIMVQNSVDVPLVYEIYPKNITPDYMKSASHKYSEIYSNLMIPFGDTVDPNPDAPDYRFRHANVEMLTAKLVLAVADILISPTEYDRDGFPDPIRTTPFVRDLVAFVVTSVYEKNMKSS